MAWSRIYRVQAASSRSSHWRSDNNWQRFYNDQNSEGHRQENSFECIERRDKGDDKHSNTSLCSSCLLALGSLSHRLMSRSSPYRCNSNQRSVGKIKKNCRFINCWRIKGPSEKKFKEWKTMKKGFSEIQKQIMPSNIWM